FILNDANSLAEFIGSLAMDVVKIGIASAVSWGIGALVVTPFVALNLVIVVAVGFVAVWGLTKLDDKFGVTDKVVAYIEAAQQEFVEKAREMEQGLWDLGAMYADRMLDKGKEVIEYEIRKYIRESLNDISTRKY
ncbi:PAAR domain-containing protein, partial [Yersinia aleksiciae]|nr:PAAR domain-containing protein [Yersinia aleksiciae]